MIHQWLFFIRSGIWKIRLKQLPRHKAWSLKLLRIVLLTARRFQENQCPLQASSLTFYSLLSIVPVMGMLFGIAKGFGFEKVLERQLMAQFEGQQEVLLKVIEFARTLIENTRGGLIAGIGICVLFWSVIKVLGHIEQSLNEIWEIRHDRAFGRKFTDYLSIMLFAPILILLSHSLTVFITTQITRITEKIGLLGTFSPLIFFLLRLFPYGLIWIVFTTIYILMPNTRVKFSSGLTAGILAGSAYQFVQWTYIKFQVGAAQYNAIYGSFAALPLFLIWLQISWLIVLIGAEFSYACQNVDHFELDPDFKTLSPYLQQQLTLMVAHLIVKRFALEQPPLTERQLSEKLDIPLRPMHRILTALMDTGLFVVATRPDSSTETVYQPARDINDLTVGKVIAALESSGITSLPVSETDNSRKIAEIQDAFQQLRKQSPGNRLLKDL